MLEPEPAAGGGDRHGGFLRNVNLVFLSTTLVSALSFVIVVAIARLLGTEGRGITALYQTSINLAYAVISFGVAIGSLYFVSRGEVAPRQALEAGLSATIASAALSALACGVIALTAGEALSDAGVPYWLAVAAIPLVVQFRLVEVLLRSDGRFLMVSIVEASIPIITLGGMLAIELVDGLTVSRAILVWSLSPLPSVAIGYAALGPSVWPRRIDVGPVMLRLAKFGLQGQAGNIVQTLNYRLDSYLVLLFVSAHGVGLYAVGVALSEGLWLVANAVAIVLVPKLASSDADYAARATPLICRSTILVTAIGAAALGAVSWVLVPLLFGRAFDGAVIPLLLLLPGVVALAGTKVLAAYVFSQGRPMYNTKISLATLVITLGGDFALIPFLGVAGAAVASSIAYAVSLALTAGVYRRMSGGPAAEALLPRAEDLALFLEGLGTLLGRSLRRAPGDAASARLESGP